jgi:diguanylate cyclase (GGDEF)-like protein
LLAFAAAATVAALVLAYATLRPSPASSRRPLSRLRVRDRREHAPRRTPDPRQALALVGNALAATHDPTALLPVILEVVAEGTGARGAELLEGGVRTAVIGEIGAGISGTSFHFGESLDGEPVTLVVYPFAGGFSAEMKTFAEWLSSQAAVAFENARLHKTVQRQAITDDLTGLPNRRHFMDLLAAEIARSGALGTPLAVVLADLDDFKRINDDGGHQLGDTVLATFAELVSAHVRDIDVPGRLGGEEFAILLRETDAHGAAAVAERIRRALPGAVATVAAVPSPVTASFGVAELRETQSVDDLLRCADVALYRAKRAGKNCVDVENAAK